MIYARNRVKLCVGVSVTFILFCGYADFQSNLTDAAHQFYVLINYGKQLFSAERNHHRSKINEEYIRMQPRLQSALSNASDQVILMY